VGSAGSLDASGAGTAGGVAESGVAGAAVSAGALGGCEAVGGGGASACLAQPNMTKAKSTEAGASLGAVRVDQRWPARKAFNDDGMFRSVCPNVRWNASIRT
jgi:hypothetical protein